MPQAARCSGSSWLKEAGASTLVRWPTPARLSSRAPAIASAMGADIAAGIIRSPSEVITSVGTLIPDPALHPLPEGLGRVLGQQRRRIGGQDVAFGSESLGQGPPALGGLRRVGRRPRVGEHQTGEGLGRPPPGLE